MINLKIEKLTIEVCDYYKNKLQTLLSVCKRPIKKLFLIDFIKFYAQSCLSIYTMDFVYDDLREIGNGYELINYGPESTNNSKFVLHNGPEIHLWFKDIT